MALDGDALGTVEGYVVFVRGALPGERVAARVVTSGRKFGRAHLVKVLRSSPHRVAPPCRHFGPCGGCSWQHIAYPEQLRLKSSMLSSTIAHALGGRPPKVKPTIGIDREASGPWGFRNKVHFVLGRGQGATGLVMGHYMRDSRRIVGIAECPIHSPAGNRIAFRIRNLLEKHGVPGTDHETLRGVARHLIVRVAEHTGESQATLVTTDPMVPGLKTIVRELASGPDAPGGIHLNVNDRPGPFLFGRATRKLHGKDRLLDEVAGVRFVVSPKAFFQTNVRCAEKLVEVVMGHVPRDDRRPILDLYAGAGLFSLPLARRGHRVISVEENPVAVKDGISSLGLNDVPEGACRFIQGRVEDVIRDMCDGSSGEPSRFGTAILDPPREGCPAAVLGLLVGRLRIDRIIYVSCNPRALAADLALATERHYRIVEVQPVDMFPHTPHIESVALLCRPESGRAGRPKAGG